MFFLLSFMVFLLQNGEQEGRIGLAQRQGVNKGGGEEEVVKIVNTHVSKCKNDTC
jgi:hypothetical protein